MRYSPTITRVMNYLRRLPGVGVHTAERFVFYWLKSGKKEATEFMLALKELIETVKSCERCWNFSDTNPCPVCTDPKRDQTTLCVVAEVQDLSAIETTGEYRGLYHVLRGTLDPSDETSVERIKIKELIARIARELPRLREIILALNPDLTGETTMLYIGKNIQSTYPGLKTTRLARGLPLGADIRYADEITLTNALKGRTER